LSSNFFLKKVNTNGSCHFSKKASVKARHRAVLAEEGGNEMKEAFAKWPENLLHKFIF